ncbi:MAG: putative outer membrane lipoprotein [Candidatus Accumulibacter sp. BA-94]|nr:MAG: putative outer membrane lipoprotein [Candidatus Accumulibacter sp. BA-94]
MIKIINIVALMIVPLMVPAGGVKPADAAHAAAAPATAMAALPAAKMHFESGSAALPAAALPADAAATLELVVVYAKANPNAKLVIAGFHDDSGSAEANADLAKNRAMAVAEALKNVGIAEARIEMKKPALTVGSGDPADARRVEVSVQ